MISTNKEMSCFIADSRRVQESNTKHYLPAHDEELPTSAVLQQ